MELRQLQYFIETVRSGSLTRAAQKLALTQPALSQQIQNLEREIGNELLERGPKGLKLTPKGKTFLHHAVEVLDAADNLYEATRTTPALDNLKIYSGQTISSWVLPQILPLLKKEFPGLFIEVREGDASFLKDALLSGEADLVIIAEPIVDTAVVSSVLCEDKIAPAAPASHRLARKEEIELKDFYNEAFIFYHRDSAIQKVSEQMLRTSNLYARINVEMEIRSLSSMVKYIEAGLGLGFLSSLVQEKRLKTLPIAELTFKRKFYLSYRKKKEIRLQNIAGSILKIAQKSFA